MVRAGRFSLLATCCIGLAAAIASLSCDRHGPGGAATRPGPHRIASLVPAATDMILAMGAADALVAVSNYDYSPQVAALPRVGDYEKTEWETLARLRPSAMIIQVSPQRVPPGLQKRADELGIALVNVQIERLDDVFTVMARLGEVIGRQEAAAQAAKDLSRRLEQVRRAAARRPAARVLLVRDADGQDVFGPDTFLDDILKVVNATNVAGGLRGRYPSIDRETLLSLAPEVVIALLPEATPAMLQRARNFWAQMTRIPAVQHQRIYFVTDRHALLAGPHLADLAEQFNRFLSGPATAAAPSTQKDKNQ